MLCLCSSVCPSQAGVVRKWLNKCMMIKTMPHNSTEELDEITIKSPPNSGGLGKNCILSIAREVSSSETKIWYTRYGGQRPYTHYPTCLGQEAEFG